MRSRLLIFAKYPHPGGVKTRLVPPFTAEEAAAFYRAFLLDALDVVRSIDSRVEPMLYISRDEDLDAMRELVGEMGEGLGIRVQRGEGLGDRLMNAFLDAFSDGCSAACAIGTDHPTLPPAYIDSGLDALDDHDLAIGPADDGGYYLIGMRKLEPRILLGMPYSQPGLLERTLETARDLGLRVCLLPPWYDVDDFSSLLRLFERREELPPGSRTGELFGTMESRIMAVVDTVRRGAHG